MHASCGPHCGQAHDAAQSDYPTAHCAGMDMVANQPLPLLYAHHSASRKRLERVSSAEPAVETVEWSRELHTLGYASFAAAGGPDDAANRVHSTVARPSVGTIRRERGAHDE